MIGRPRRLFSPEELAARAGASVPRVVRRVGGGSDRRAPWAKASFALAVGMVVAASAPWVGRAPLALINITPSEPPGLYLHSTTAPARGLLVAFTPPAVSSQVGDGRLGRFHSFLKQVAAVAGDQVCSDGTTARINGVVAGSVAQHDSRGRPLPRWTGCRRLAAGEVFVLSNRVPNSFDSRYFGPVSSSTVIGVYRPIWTRP